MLLKAVTEKIVMEFIGEVVIYRLTGMSELLQIEQRILVGIASHIVKQNIHVNLHSIEKLVVDDYSKAFY